MPLVKAPVNMKGHCALALLASLLVSMPEPAARYACRLCFLARNSSMHVGSSACSPPTQAPTHPMRTPVNPLTPFLPSTRAPLPARPLACSQCSFDECFLESAVTL